ncbi:MAG: UpxY family transcription antiterminator [Candidatus Brocadia sp.]
MDRNVAYWFAVHTRSRHEKQVDSFLKEKRIDSFLPLIKTPSRRKDRVKFVDIPLFKGYLFVKIPLCNVCEVINTRGVVRIIGTDRFTPIPIPEKQVNDIKLLVNSNIKLDPYKYLATGTRIRVTSGPLVGIEGILLEKKANYRVVVSIDLLQRSASAEVCIADIEPIN